MSPTPAAPHAPLRLHLLDRRSTLAVLVIGALALLGAWIHQEQAGLVRPFDRGVYGLGVVCWTALALVLRGGHLHPWTALRLALLVLAGPLVAGMALPWLWAGLGEHDRYSVLSGLYWLSALQFMFFATFAPRHALACSAVALGVVAAAPWLAIAWQRPAAGLARDLQPLLINALSANVLLNLMVFAIARQMERVIARRGAADESIAGTMHIDELVALRARGVDRLRSTAQARDAELQAMLQAFPGLVVRFEGRDQRLSYANAAFASLMKADVDALLGRTLDELAWTEGADAFRARAQRITVSGQPVSFEQSLAGEDGSTHWLVTQFQVPATDGGNPTHYQIAVDIADRKRAEQAQAEARRVAERASRAKDEFLSHISHELRTPVNGVLGFAQLLRGQAHGWPPREAAWLAALEHSSRHLAALVDDALDHARMEAGAMRLNDETVDLAAAALAALETVRPAAQSRGIALGIDGLDAGLRARGDALRVRQVLMNLASNAVKYNRDGGCVSIVLSQQGASVLATVVDTGAGLVPAQLERLFTPFDRLGAEKSRIQGAGIGLSVSRRLARLMGGDVVAASRPGTGSRFTLQLPSARPADADEPGSGFAPFQATPGVASRHLLYVEDNEVNRLLFEACIQAQPAWSLALAADGAAAEREVAQCQPDLVVLDLNLPDVDGFALADRLRDGRLRGGTPIVLLTADGGAEVAARAAGAGIAAVWHKPIEPRRLLDALHAMLHPAGAQPVDGRVAPVA